MSAPLTNAFIRGRRKTAVGPQLRYQPNHWIAGVFTAHTTSTDCQSPSAMAAIGMTATCNIRANMTYHILACGRSRPDGKKTVLTKAQYPVLTNAVLTKAQGSALFC